MSATLDNYRLFIDGHFPEPTVQPSGAVLMGLGNSTARALTDRADVNWLSFYFENTSTGTSNRGLYLREYLSGTASGGEAARIFTSVQNVVADTAHGAHISLNFGSTGKLTGLGAASRSTLHIPNDGTQQGTLTAAQVEIWSDGSDSDPAGATEVSFLRFVAGGHADGISDLQDDAFLFSVQGVSAGADGAVSLFRNVAPTTLAASLRVKVGSTSYYLPLYSGQS
jgi:hypothetical protein